MTTRIVAIKASDAAAYNAKLEPTNGPNTFVSAEWDEETGEPVGDIFVCGYTPGTILVDVANDVDIKKTASVYNETKKEDVIIAEKNKLDPKVIIK